MPSGVRCGRSTCPHHHSLVHTAGWVVTLCSNRELTLTLPAGSIHNPGPPGRKAA